MIFLDHKSYVEFLSRHEERFLGEISQGVDDHSSSILLGMFHYLYLSIRSIV